MSRNKCACLQLVVEPFDHRETLWGLALLRIVGPRSRQDVRRWRARSTRLASVLGLSEIHRHPGGTDLFVPWWFANALRTCTELTLERALDRLDPLGPDREDLAAAVCWQLRAISPQPDPARTVNAGSTLPDKALVRAVLAGPRARAKRSKP